MRTTLKGGRRSNAGRKKGIPNRLTKAQVERALASNEILPLDLLLAIMRDENLDIAFRADVAVKAAPYLHHRMSTTDPVEKPKLLEESPSKPELMLPDFSQRPRAN